MRVAVGVDENLEVVVLEDHRVVLGEGAPDVRLLQFGRDVEVVIVPEHLDAGLKTRAGLFVPLDIDEIVRPRRVVPRRIVELSINHHRCLGAIRQISLGRRKSLPQRDRR